jgi:sugar phosphate isomerase/epimerase
MKGPAIFLAQFIGDAQPFDSFDAICGWAAGLGYKGVQVPTSDPRLIDIDKAAASQTYCDEIAGVAASHGLVITELSTHLQGQLVAVHPAYNEAFDAFAPPAVRGKPKERQIWAVDQMMKAAQASRRLGLTGSVSFTGALAWPFLYPWPQRPPGLIETAFDELARRWRPILDVYEEAGVDLCYEIHPGEDVCDGITFEMFYERTGNHPRCAINYDPSHFVLQQLDYLAFIDIYAERIRAFHVKDAEFNPTGRQGVYSGFQSWINRAGRFRSLGDGQGDIKAIL